MYGVEVGEGWLIAVEFRARDAYQRAREAVREYRQAGTRIRREGTRGAGRYWSNKDTGERLVTIIRIT